MIENALKQGARLGQGMILEWLGLSFWGWGLCVFSQHAWVKWAIVGAHGTHHTTSLDRIGDTKSISVAISVGVQHLHVNGAAGRASAQPVTLWDTYMLGAHIMVACCSRPRTWFQLPFKPCSTSELLIRAAHNTSGIGPWYLIAAAAARLCHFAK